MNTSLKVALTGLFVAGAVALSAGSVAAADGGNGNGNGPVGPDGVALIPLFGHPYASARSDGGFFVGTVDFEVFEVDGNGGQNGGQLVLHGRLLSQDGVIETVFPVQIHDASCDHFILDIGPPPVLGLQDPLVLVETFHENQMRTADFCTIAQALQDGDLETVVFELNEVEELEAGLIGENSCPWYTYLECGTAIAACSASCVLGPEVCLPCFAAIVGTVLAPHCLDCLQ